MEMLLESGVLTCLTKPPSFIFICLKQTLVYETKDSVTTRLYKWFSKELLQILGS